MSMASSSSSPSDVTFSSEVWKYHVFLSFRGEDTRKTFVDHLYTALEQQGIFTYKDDETLPWGESIGPSLVTAIEESQIAIIIFSKNYADSSWCLDELVHIIKCKDTRGQIVMPIFYDVDPSEVRKQKHKYGEAFVKHELKNKTKVESWRKALVDASNISGWETEYVANGHESKCIKEIVDTISQRLQPITSSGDDNLVGVEARMEHFMPKLQIEFGGKRMIGIWGVGGGGKTTLASSVYDEISSKFDGCCFLKNIREESSNQNGLERLQEQILCTVLKQKQLNVGRVEEGRHMIKDRLHHRKVLIVLDDVDNLEHLEQLDGSRDWFGEGSRILITTRDEHVLTGHKVDVIHNISLLNNDEAMKLFCKHAPCGHKPIEDYKLLSKDVVAYAGGLPLALRILNANILEKLKISFDGLKTVEKQLFLDIACFFRGHDYKDEKIMMILDACGYHPVIGIKVLVQNTLITITENGRFDMHDMVQEMAHYIVTGEHPKNPEKHSRVWKEDVLQICAMDATMNLDKIEAIYVESPMADEPQRVLQVVANMKKLRWIDLRFHLAEAELVILPENFPPRELCCLTLRFLNAKQLWEGYKTPDFYGIPNLERFIVVGSRLLEEIHPTFGLLEKLVCVEIRNCDNLQIFPSIIRSKKLKTLVFSNCGSFYNFLPNTVKHTEGWFLSGCLRKLNLSFCELADGDIRSAAGWELPNLKELNLATNKFVQLNFSLLRLRRLKWLNVSHCILLVQLLELPSSIAVVIADECWSLESFGDISNCRWLWKLSLLGKNKLGPLGGDILLNCMLQGNAKAYFISFVLRFMES
ncbi:unnamed protein product [Lactuca virosa]|uniref:TIR domain-containing protein n=1 Tax=Lactuca virosa TaxID=75947 RepID=A0AAU9NA46_9ASTR|nr:unnamed protein product [Lactuca virosa]